jgi:hypothetical protein
MKKLSVLFKIFLYLSLVLCGVIHFCQAEDGKVRLGDSGKCGRDCIYYICHRYGQQVTLNDIEQQLSGQKDIAFSDIRKALEIKGKGMNNEDEIILLTNIVGYISQEK